MNKGTPKKMSPLQLDANRRNGRRSRGPTTPQGKARSRMNALKHGLLAHETLVTGLCLKESADELDALRRRFLAHCAPVGPIEEMLVDQIVSCHWRKRRVLRAESGEVAVSVDGGMWQRTDAWVEQWGRWQERSPGQRKLAMDSRGMDYLIRTLQEAQEAFEAAGELAEDELERVEEVFGTEPHGVALSLSAINEWREDNPDGLEPEALKGQYQREMKAYIQEQLDMFKQVRVEVEQREEVDESARQRAAELPAVEVMEKIRRYEAALDRQLFRLLAQLERWQRLRREGKLPEPVEIPPEKSGRTRKDVVGGETPGGRITEGKTKTSSSMVSPSVMSPKKDRRKPWQKAAGKARPGKEGRRKSGFRTARAERYFDALREALEEHNRTAPWNTESPDETNPNDGSVSEQEPSVSNGKPQLPAWSGEGEGPQNCETNPNEPVDGTTSPEDQDGGSLPTT